MGQYHLKSMFNPRHIAVVGASEKKGTIGHALMKNLIDSGFSGMILPVNPKYKTIQGHDCVKSVRDLMPGASVWICGAMKMSAGPISKLCHPSYSINRMQTLKV
jgi:acetyltransferase